jgi:hypothetical protein
MKGQPMPDQQLEDFERRVLALIRHRLSHMEEDNPGYEIGDFVLTFEYSVPPDPDEEIDPWAGGRYAGWWPNGMTFGSGITYEIDRALVWDAWLFVDRKYSQWHEEWLASQDQVDEEDEPGHGQRG